MRLKPGSCVHHSFHPHVIYLWAWMDKTQDPCWSGAVTAGSDHLWNPGSAKGWEHSQMSKHKGRLAQRQHPAAEHCLCTVTLVVTESRGWGQAKLGHSSSSDSGWKEYSPEIREQSVWWAGLPSLLSSPNALTKQQDKKCFLGYSWLKTQEENILVCPQKTMKACSCLGHRTSPVQNWDLVVTGSGKAVEVHQAAGFPSPSRQESCSQQGAKHGFCSPSWLCCGLDAD